jgi:hypothetical protein
LRIFSRDFARLQIHVENMIYIRSALESSFGTVAGGRAVTMGWRSRQCPKTSRQTADPEGADIFR